MRVITIITITTVTVGIIVGVLGIIVGVAGAQTCLEDSGEQIEIPSTETEPVEYVTDDLCYGWSASSGAVDHYHFYVNGVIEGSPTARAFQWKMPAQDFTNKIEVDAVGIVQGAPSSPVSDPYFMRWVARDTTMVCVEEKPAQCLDVDRVVECP